MAGKRLEGGSVLKEAAPGVGVRKFSAAFQEETGRQPLLSLGATRRNWFQKELATTALGQEKHWGGRSGVALGWLRRRCGSGEGLARTPLLGWQAEECVTARGCLSPSRGRLRATGGHGSPHPAAAAPVDEGWERGDSRVRGGEELTSRGKRR